ncbi:hypothetical protein J1N51_10940 [Psychrosphaera ytuae]|uniref:Uncharacterized protein n=1 Tax=Psychrosphaera ytuae TaxID=2820710 RepID=A0A975DAM0_9GAMM|nr:hypothetical protein [Psychrosphaera ytuae]QTH63249.1 hypothetical protein J1N51_10940 [Psychrosphaera ytuae]
MEKQISKNVVRKNTWQVTFCWGIAVAFVSLVLSHSPKSSWVGYDSEYLINNAYSTLYIFIYVVAILPLVQEWILRAVLVDIFEVMSLPVWIAALASAYLSMTYLPLRLLDPMAHFVLSIYLFHIYFKHRSLKLSMLNAGFVHLCIFVVMYVTNQLPNQ